MSLLRRMSLLLAVAALLAGAAWAVWQHQGLRAQRLQDEVRQLAEAEEAFNRLGRDLKRFEEARTKVGAESGFARHEKIALSARLSAAELARLNDILQRAYADEGFLLLKNFSLGWGQQGELALQLNGEKVFVR
jgi:type II secretory pathway component PulJ